MPRYPQKHLTENQRQRILSTVTHSRSRWTAGYLTGVVHGAPLHLIEEFMETEVYQHAIESRNLTLTKWSNDMTDELINIHGTRYTTEQAEKLGLIEIVDDGYKVLTGKPDVEEAEELPSGDVPLGSPSGATVTGTSRKNN